MKKSIVYTLLFVSILQSCGTSSNVTSNFALQKRKYTKGWNLKEMFQRKQAADASTLDESKLISTKEAKPIEIKTENISETKLNSETTTGELTKEKRIDPITLRNSSENKDAIVENKQISGTPTIEHAETVDSKDENSELQEDTPKKINDDLFRRFFIFGFALAIIACILAPFSLTAETAVGLLLLLFIVDIASLVIVTILLVNRHKNKDMYKESSFFVILTEVLFGIVSYLTLLFFNAYSAF